MISVIMTFLEGLASFLSPCTLPMMPVYVAYFSAEDRTKISTCARAVVAGSLGWSWHFADPTTGVPFTHQKA